jgi:DNA-binding transcriptional LysR family regulator
VIELAREAEERLAELRGLERGELRIGQHDDRRHLLPAVFVAFRKAYPGIRLTVDIGNASEIEERLTAGGIVAAQRASPMRRRSTRRRS